MVHFPNRFRILRRSLLEDRLNTWITGARLLSSCKRGDRLHNRCTHLNSTCWCGDRLHSIKRMVNMTGQMEMPTCASATTRTSPKK